MLSQTIFLSEMKYRIFSKKSPLLKSNTKGFVKSNGRNNTGKVTCYHKGGGHKRLYRNLDTMNHKSSLKGVVMSIEYDPNRSCFISSLFNYDDRKFYYIPTYANCSIGDIVKSGFGAELYTGHTLKLIDIPEGTIVSNLTNNLCSERIYSRSAGTSIFILEKTKSFCHVKLPSGISKKISLQNCATIGSVSVKSPSVFLSNKAGRSRWLNNRPTVRGVAMNPIDHPHGGGEGKKSGRKYTPWGKL